MNTAYAATETTEKVSQTASELTKLFEFVIAKIPLWIVAFGLVLLSFIIAKIARRVVENKLAEKGIEEEHKELQILGGRLTHSGILVIGITSALKIAGIDLTTIIAAGAFGIGFALKDLIMNFLAGIMILVGRHFTIGDYINIGGTIGKVVEIQSRVTVLQAIDGTKVIVPNATIFKQTVTSYTSNPFRRIEVAIGVSYESDLENAIKICHQVLKNSKGVLPNPKPSVLIGEFGDYDIPIKLRAWVDSRSGWLKIKSDLTLNIKKELDKYNIVMPWPTYSISYEKDQKADEKQFVDVPDIAQKGQVVPQSDIQTVDQPEISETLPVTPVLPIQPMQPLQPAMVPVPVVENTPPAAPAQNSQDVPLKPLGEV